MQFCDVFAIVVDVISLYFHCGFSLAMLSAWRVSIASGDGWGVDSARIYGVDASQSRSKEQQGNMAV